MFKDYSEYFSWANVQIEHFYAYLFIAALIAAYLVWKGNAKFKLELFFIAFFLLTGNINRLLTFKIPGISFFEIQPIRFIYLLLAFFLLRNTLLSRSWRKQTTQKLPLFIFSLISFLIFLIISASVNSSSMGIAAASTTILEAVAFIIIIYSLRFMADKASYKLIGIAFIIGAVVSSIVALVQFSVDPYFLRMGDARVAFGSTLRSNGIFRAEYYHSYFLILALIWNTLLIKNRNLRTAISLLLIAGVISSFQRMSWIILAFTIFTYVVFIKKVAIEKIIAGGLAGLALLLTINLFYSKEIRNSALIKERLSDTIEGRIAYYTLVLESIDKKPFLGYGDFNNEVFYKNMLRITSDRDRADATTGGLHSGYFTVLYLYGIPAFVSFFLFVVLTIFYFARSQIQNPQIAIPLVAGCIFLLANLTNTFLFLSYLSVIYAISIGIGLGIIQAERQNELIVTS